MSAQAKNAPLINGVSQFDIDFVIPRAGVDIRVGIDPFLLFKSRDERLARWHEELLAVFAHGIRLLRDGKEAQAAELLRFPEVSEIGMGYATGSKRGSGVGALLSNLVLETLAATPRLLERGVRHVEELQLLSVGIGPDRVSDICAGILKRELVQYTQEQCALWGIDVMSGVPVEHLLNVEDMSWADAYVDLPTSPWDGTPILLVPRRVVRQLPWINYRDYARTEFAAYLRARSAGRSKKTSVEKRDLVAVSRQELDRVDRYIDKKEAAASEAQPSVNYLDKGEEAPRAAQLADRLTGVVSGHSDATKYQRLCLEILNFLFNPELIDGRLEERTLDGTERRDIIFTNDSDATFWTYLRQEHASFVVMFEAKNKEKLTNLDLAQVATYLGERLGRIGFILCRSEPSDAQVRKALSIYNDSNPRKIIIFIADADLERMLKDKGCGQAPMRHLQRLYRAFRTSAQ